MSNYKRTKQEAKSAYYYWAGNDPVVHANRMPDWKDLSKEERKKWRDPNFYGNPPRERKPHAYEC